MAGAGLSGSAVVAQLAARAPVPMSVLVLDDGSRPARDAGWAFWSRTPEVLDPAVHARFDRVRVHAGGRTQVLDLQGYRYAALRGTDLQVLVGGMVRSDQRFTVRAGHVEAIADGPGRACVRVDGQDVKADWVLDSVLGPPDPPEPDARLVFTGLRVRTDRPVFDAAVPTLFDFRTPQAAGAGFFYVLPDGPHRALVEHTAFVPPGHAGPQRPEEAVAEYLHAVLGCDDYQVEGTEHGDLALRTAPVARRHGRVLALGERGGLVRASTGFAARRIQRDAAAIADSLVRRRHPFDLPRPGTRPRLLDAALLDALGRDPQILERTFATLFDGSRTALALRFLDGETSIREEAALFRGLPVARLAAALARART